MRLLPRSPGNLVLAVVLACLVWYANALDRRERISERQLDTALTLVNVPADTVITSEVPRFLSLRVRGPLSRLRTLDQAQTGVVIDLRGATEGEHDFPVETRNVVVPAGVEVLAVSPPAGAAASRADRASAGRGQAAGFRPACAGYDGRYAVRSSRRPRWSADRACSCSAAVRDHRPGERGRRRRERGGGRGGAVAAAADADR